MEISSPKTNTLWQASHLDEEEELEETLEQVSEQQSEDEELEDEEELEHWLQEEELEEELLELELLEEDGVYVLSVDLYGSFELLLRLLEVNIFLMLLPLE